MFKVVLFTLLLYSVSAFSKEAFEFSDLSVLRNALDTRNAGHARILDFEHDYSGFQLRSYQNAIYYETLSWIFLADASSENPFRSKELDELVEKKPECLNRILLEVIEKQLRQIDTPRKREAVMNSLFERGGFGENMPFNSHLWVREQNDHYKLFMLGTNSHNLATDLRIRVLEGEGHKGVREPGGASYVRLSAVIKESITFLETLWRYRGGEISERHFQSALACDISEISFTNFFPWFDRESVYIVVEDTTSSISDLKEKIENIATTSWLPQYPDKNDHIDFSVIPGKSIAMRPTLGLLLADAKVSPRFVEAYLELVAEKAYTKNGFLKYETCQAMGLILKWGNVIGFSIPMYNKKAFGVTKENFREMTKIITAVVGMKDASNIDHKYACYTVSGHLERLWNHYFGERSSLTELYRKDLERGGITSNRKYAYFMDVDTGWFIKNGIYKIKDGKYVKEPRSVELTESNIEEKRKLEFRYLRDVSEEIRSRRELEFQKGTRIQEEEVR
jgi:hypothetical protein